MGQLEQAELDDELVNRPAAHKEQTDADAKEYLPGEHAPVAVERPLVMQ